MCTVSLIPIDDFDAGDPQDPARRGFRMACNRDESRRRAAALPPRVQRFADRAAIMPVDPVSNGTWVAVNDAGLVATLLNVYAEPAAPRPTGPAGQDVTDRLSRGRIIPMLMHCDRLTEALDLALRLDGSLYPPFKLVLVDGGHWVQVQGDGRRLTSTPVQGWAQPVMFTSSGLGDLVVEGPRRALFREFFPGGAEGRGQPETVPLQDAFHRHSWPERPHVSVCMRRAEACTVSVTTIEVRRELVVLGYHAGAPDEPAEEFRLSLQRRTV